MIKETMKREVESIGEMLGEIMALEGKNEIHMLISAEVEGEDLRVTLGELDLKGLKNDLFNKTTRIKELEKKVSNLEREIIRSKDRLKRTVDRNNRYRADLFHERKKVQELEKQLKGMNGEEDYTYIENRKIQLLENYTYGSIFDYEVDQDIIKLCQCGYLKLIDNNIVIVEGAICRVDTDKHGYSLMFECEGKEIELQCCLLTEEIANDLFKFNIVG